MKKIFTALLLVAAIFSAGCSKNESPPVEVSVAKVIPVDGAITVTHDGKIAISNEQKVLSTISGNVLATYFESGQAVEADQPLFKIGNQKDNSELLQAKTLLGEAMANLARARSELAQAESKLRLKTGSPDEVAEKKSVVDECQATVTERQEVVQKLEDAAAAGIVKAPTAGYIGGERIQLGATVTANETVLTTIGKMNPVAVRVEVSDEEKNFIQSSPAAKVTLKLSDGTIYPRAGKINFVNATTLEVTFDNPIDKLALNDAVQLIIEGVNVPKAVLVPESAVQLRGGDNYVFIVDSNKTAVLKKISGGGKLGTNFVVKEGLQATDSVIVDGLKDLREGSPLKIAN